MITEFPSATPITRPCRLTCPCLGGEGWVCVLGSKGMVSRYVGGGGRSVMRSWNCFPDNTLKRTNLQTIVCHCTSAHLFQLLPTSLLRNRKQCLLQWVWVVVELLFCILRGCPSMPAFSSQLLCGTNGICFVDFRGNIFESQFHKPT